MLRRIPWLVVASLSACSSAGSAPEVAPPASSVTAGAAHDPGHLPVRALDALDRVIEGREVFVKGDGSCERWSIAPDGVVDDQQGAVRLAPSVDTEPMIVAHFTRQGPVIDRACATLGNDTACFPCDGAGPSSGWFASEDDCRESKDAITPAGCTEVFTKAFRERARASLDGSLRTALIARLEKKPFYRGERCQLIRPRRKGGRLLFDPDSLYSYEMSKGRGGTLIVEEVTDPNPRYHERPDSIGIGCCDRRVYRVLSVDDHRAVLETVPGHADEQAHPEVWSFDVCHP